MTRDGSCTLARFWRRGANLVAGAVSSVFAVERVLFPPPPLLSLYGICLEASVYREPRGAKEEHKTEPKKRAKTHNRMVLKTLLTFKSITFAKALSGCVSNFSPHVAPAFANKISTWSVVLLTSRTRCSTPSILALSAGTEIALAPGCRFGSALRAAQADSQAAALRDVMYTLEAPAWRNLRMVRLQRRRWREWGKGRREAQTQMQRGDRDLESHLLRRRPSL